jgi:hypothetical protein
MADTDYTATQADKFKKLARELECDEDEDAFKAKLRQIVKPPVRPAGDLPQE